MPEPIDIICRFRKMWTWLKLAYQLLHIFLIVLSPWSPIWMLLRMPLLWPQYNHLILLPNFVLLVLFFIWFSSSNYLGALERIAIMERCVFERQDLIDFDPLLVNTGGVLTYLLKDSRVKYYHCFRLENDLVYCLYLRLSNIMDCVVLRNFLCQWQRIQKLLFSCLKFETIVKFEIFV